MQGELLNQIEVFTSAEDVQIATTPTSGRFGILCAALRFITTTGRVVQTGDANEMGALPDALYSRLACKGPLSDSDIHSFQVRHGELVSVTTMYCPRALLRHGLLTNSQIRKLWVGVLHHIHGTVMKCKDGQRFGSFSRRMAHLSRCLLTR